MDIFILVVWILEGIMSFVTRHDTDYRYWRVVYLFTYMVLMCQLIDNLF